MPRIAYVAIEDGPQVRCACPQDLAIHKGDLCVAEVEGLLEFGQKHFLPMHPDFMLWIKPLKLADIAASPLG